MKERSFLYDPNEYIGKLRKKLIHKEFKPSVSAAVSTIVMFVLIFLVYNLKIPNPNMVLIAGLVICSALFSYSGGIPAAVIMMGYTMFFFSENNNFITFSGQNAQKLIVSLFGIIVNTFFVCELKKRELTASGNVSKLIEQLNIENERLHAISMFDSKEFFSQQYSKGYFDCKTMGFGEVTYSETELTDIIVNYIKSGFLEKDIYKQRCSDFFPLNDKNNCSRIYNEIIKLYN